MLSWVLGTLGDPQEWQLGGPRRTSVSISLALGTYMANLVLVI